MNDNQDNQDNYDDNESSEDALQECEDRIDTLERNVSKIMKKLGLPEESEEDTGSEEPTSKEKLHNLLMIKVGGKPEDMNK